MILLYFAIELVNYVQIPVLLYKKSATVLRANRDGQIAQNRGADSMGLVPGPKS